MHSFSKNPRVVFSVINSICYDQRVLKIAETVSNLGCDITIIGRITSNCCESEEIPFRNVRFRMFFKRSFLFYASFNIRLFFYLLFHRFDILVSNDLDTLLPNFLVSKLKHIKLVYDSHEYFTGVPEIKNRPFVRWAWTVIEKKIFPRLKHAITVSESIASLYEELYGLRPHIIRNLGKKSDHITPLTREELGIAPNDLIAIIQGNGINIDKGAEELIDAVGLITGIVLLVVGSGDVVPNLKLRVNELNIGQKVIFIPSVPWEILISYTKSADVGMCLEKDTNLNYRFSLPNKLFDYISAGIPVIASNLPETSKILGEYNCGLLIHDVTPKEIFDALSLLKMDRSRLLKLKNNAIVASEKLNWEIESKRVVEFYKKVLKE